MQTMPGQQNASLWRVSIFGWTGVFVALFLISFLFYDGIRFLLDQWNLPEYSYGYLIPLISIFLVWQRKDRLAELPFDGSWMGFMVVLIGLGLFMMGSLGSVYAIIQYAMLVVIVGLVLAFSGKKAFRLMVPAMVMLLFMIPLPGFLYHELSGQLQLISSRLGVALIRMFGISVYLEGNVIDLGALQLQVVEACNGLRYLFPLVTLAFIGAYFYQGAMWKRVIIFLSSVPITVGMNSLRIGVIGVLSEYYGKSAAEGFLHDFEGWIIFMGCIGILLLEMLLLARIGGDRRPLRDLFGLTFPPPNAPDAKFSDRRVSVPYLAAIGALATVAVLSFAMPAPVDDIPARASFTDFPLKLGEWSGKSERFERKFVDALNFDDYLLANYQKAPTTPPINLYVGYYATQRADKVPHSPRACLPGGGWKITDFDTTALPSDGKTDRSLQVNRAVISNGVHKQLVYYWFQQRGRRVTSEYMVKWHLLWDSVSRHRSDGALVRIMTIVTPTEDIAEADRRLTGFLQQLEPLMSAYVPD